jgi:hypothetical protein
MVSPDLESGSGSVELSGSVLIPEPEAAPSTAAPPPAPASVSKPAPDIASLGAVTNPTQVVSKTVMATYSAPGLSCGLPGGLKLRYDSDTADGINMNLSNGKIAGEFELPRGAVIPIEMPIANGENVTLTLNYRGQNATGQKEVECVVTGSMTALNWGLQALNRVGSAALTSLQKLYHHLPETVVALFGAGIAVCAGTMGWIKSNTLYLGIAVVAVMIIESLALWTGIERKKKLEN